MILLKTLVLEGRYDSLVTQLSNHLMRVVKDSYESTKTDSGEFAGKKIYFKQGESVPEIHGEDYYDVYFEEVENETIPIDCYLSLKYIPSDQALRRKIESGKLPPADYFTLPQEIPAMIQGMYFKAKKSKKPFAQVVDEYLQLWVDNAAMTSQEKQSIIDTWKTYLPKLGIKATL